MNIKDCGEFGFIDLIKDNTIYEPKTVVYGIGDDCAVYKAQPHMEQLITTDMMVEGIHFSKQTTTPFHVGFRLGAANISDIAAMGGTPLEAVISIALPPEMELSYIQDIFQGLKTILKKYKVNLIGGDTVSTTGPLVLNVTLIGQVPSGQAIYRHGAQVGDIVFVTHTVGSAAAGLYALTHDLLHYEEIKKAHQMPIPQVEIGQALNDCGCHSLNDISDGLSSELNEIAKASHVELVIEEKQIPLHNETQLLSAKALLNPYEFAWFGGEDFQLVGTMSEESYIHCTLKEYIKPIGYVKEAHPVGTVTVHTAQGRTVTMDARGYNHFTK
ncbi:thiamine-phosphate kinase [uncultured Veillonella sp.]|uniref:thiamine-phosphate kinase n=1 Tax=uncultured Veillonella sp. TaxID=159268 RepID=UPI00260D0782|nr:thiamine-phosphate kinase [uncultured Veillonella sp.]